MTQPNILVIMSDEHGPMFSSTYGHPFVQTPHMDELAARGVTFDAAYCNSPLCAPSRASFMTGKHVNRIGTYDNDATFPADAVTWAHMLRANGYHVVLDGKMHFMGPDTLHGFERQLTRDIRGGRITGKEWPRPGSRNEAMAGDASFKERISNAGIGRSHYLDFDDDVEQAAVDWLRAPERRAGGPWCLLTGFISPHFPLVVPADYFNRYYPHRVDLPVRPPADAKPPHPAHERVRRTFGLDDVDEEQVRVARAAYYGLVSYLDDKIGRLMATLRSTGQLENTVVVYTSDHGEFVGDHGLWWKNDFYEQSSRVPLIISAPWRLPEGRRFTGVTSLVDITRTLVDLADAPDPGDLDGDSLLPVLESLGTSGEREALAGWKDEAICEYYGHATDRPQRMIRSGSWKYNYYHGEPAELFDLSTDPGEFRNLSGQPHVNDVEDALLRRLLDGWHPDHIDDQVRASQRARAIIAQADRT